MTCCMRVPVSKFPGQLIRSLPTKPYSRKGTAVAVSRGKGMDELVYSLTRFVGV